MARRKQKVEPEEVVEEDNDITSNAIDEIETVSETVPEPTEVNSNAVNPLNNNDVMLPRSASRYTQPLR